MAIFISIWLTVGFYSWLHEMRSPRGNILGIADYLMLPVVMAGGFGSFILLVLCK